MSLGTGNPPSCCAICSNLWVTLAQCPTVLLSVSCPSNVSYPWSAWSYLRRLPPCLSPSWPRWQIGFLRWRTPCGHVCDWSQWQWHAAADWHPHPPDSYAGILRWPRPRISTRISPVTLLLTLSISIIFPLHQPHWCVLVSPSLWPQRPQVSPPPAPSQETALPATSVTGRPTTSVTGRPISRLFFLKNCTSGLSFLVNTGTEVSVLPPSGSPPSRRTTGHSLQAANHLPIATSGTRSMTLNLGLWPSFAGFSSLLKLDMPFWVPISFTILDFLSMLEITPRGYANTDTGAWHFHGYSVCQPCPSGKLGLKAGLSVTQILKAWVLGGCSIAACPWPYIYGDWGRRIVATSVPYMAEAPRQGVGYEFRRRVVVVFFQSLLSSCVVDKLGHVTHQLAQHLLTMYRD